MLHTPCKDLSTKTLQTEVSHYSWDSEASQVSLRVSSAKTLLNVIKKNFGTLPFCRRYLDRLGQDKYLLGVRLQYPHHYFANMSSS